MGVAGRSWGEQEDWEMKVAVVGAGGVGGYFGGRLAVSGQDVTMIARGPHLEAIRERGLKVQSVKGDFTAVVPATGDAAEIGRCDVVLFCVKSYDTESAAARLGPLIGVDTAVVSLQNGIDNEDKLAAAVGAGHVIGGAAFIFSTISAPGVITHTGGPARMVFGEMNGSVSARVKQLLAACQGAAIDSEVPADIRAVLWTKYAFICAVAGMTAALRLPLGEIRACSESWTMFARILTEVISLARAEGVPLPANVVEQQLAFAMGLDPGSFSSLHHDLVTGRRMELEALHGTAVRRGARLGVSMPACEAIHAILRPWALRNE
jgi:2-dehydropantoate 2-reductase